MKICILSDSHDNRTLMGAAVADAKGRGACAVLHCGDIVAPSTLRTLQQYGLPVHAVYGNNVGDLVYMAKLAQEPNSVIHFHGQDASLNLHGRRIFVVHYPHYAKGMASTGDWDIVCCGHDHRAKVSEIDNVKGGKTWLINPGTVGGVGAPATYVLADLERQIFEVETVPVPPPDLS